MLFIFAIVFGDGLCIWKSARTRTHTHIYRCVCVCLCVDIRINVDMCIPVRVHRDIWLFWLSQIDLEAQYEWKRHRSNLIITSQRTSWTMNYLCVRPVDYYEMTEFEGTTPFISCMFATNGTLCRYIVGMCARVWSCQWIISTFNALIDLLHIFANNVLHNACRFVGLK